jgi:hypothetical protein
MGNTAGGGAAWVGGGSSNSASVSDSSVLGGKSLTEGSEYGVSAGLSEAEQSKLFSIVPYLGYEAGWWVTEVGEIKLRNLAGW